MKLGYGWGLLLLTVWACSGSVINDSPDGASAHAGRGSSESESDAGEPAGGSDSSGGSAGEGEIEAGGVGASGTPGHAGGNAGGNGGSGAGDNGNGGIGPGPGGAATCEFGTTDPTDETCSGHLESGSDDELGKACESYGGSATLAQLVGTWVYSQFWDTQETVRFAADGSATFTSFQEGTSVLTDTTTSEAIGTVDVSDTSIEFKITDQTLSLPHKPTSHESVSKTLHYWYRYDASADLLTLALCGSYAGTYER